jgi:hypothetical protein
MTASQSSRREVFRELAESDSDAWPAYESTALYDRSSLGALEEDVRTVAGVWFDHDAHESLAEFVCQLPLAHVEFDPHDQYDSHTTFDIEQMVRLFVLASVRGIDSETELVEYLRDRPAIQEELDFESVPDQSTLWRT